MVNVAWAAGLFEGEGCINLKKNWKGVSLQVNSSDKDVLQRLADIFGGSIYQTTMSKHPSHYKQMYNWTLQKRSLVINALEQMLPFFGERRACKALDAFDHYEL